MKNAFSLDWLRVTFPVKSNEVLNDYAIEDFGEISEEKSRGSYNERHGNELYSLSWHTEHPENKVMLEMTGVQLSNYRQIGGMEEHLLGQFLGDGGNFTRLDFAIDLFDTGGKVLDVKDCWNRKRMITVARKCTAIISDGEQENLGNTVYLGSRQSERMVRVYHKGRQQRTQLDWLRVELEWKGARALQLARAIITNGVRDGGLVHLRRYAQTTDVVWFEQMFLGGYEEFSIDAIGRRETDHERWLFEVAIPNIARAAINGVPGVMVALLSIIEGKKNTKGHGPNLNPKG